MRVYRLYPVLTTTVFGEIFASELVVAEKGSPEKGLFVGGYYSVAIYWIL